MSDIERAIKNLRAHMYYEIDTLPREVGIAISEAITALQEKLARERGCEWCRERKPILKDLGDLQIDDTDSTLWFTHQAAADDIYEDHAAIRFCPMCGRKLGSGEHE